LWEPGTSVGVSHRTLLAVATDGGYDCREVGRVPASAAVARRLLAASSDALGRLPTLTAVCDAVNWARHETLVVVPLEGSLRRYCALPGSLGPFRSPPRFDGPDGGALVAVAADESAEFRRLWDGARALAAVAVDEGLLSSARVRRLLAAALARLTHERDVIDRLCPGTGTSGRL